MTRYQVAVDIEVEIPGDADRAIAVVDEIMQRAWDTDDGRKWVLPKWHFEISGPGAVTDITPEDATDETKELS